MKAFLNNPDSAFYHITPINNWNGIKENGLNASDKRIFVSCVSDLSVLFAIALEQLPEIYSSEGIAIIRLPQSKNNFQSNEFVQDMQALVEWTQPFQQIILRGHIPSESIELFMTIQFHSASLRDGVINQLTAIANAGESKFANHQMRTWAEGLKYE
jgi:hypothetical protein